MKITLDGYPLREYLRCWCGLIHWRSHDGCHGWLGCLIDNIRGW